MNKQFLLLITCLLCALTLQAQTEQNQDVEKKLKKEAYNEFKPYWFLQLQGGVNYTMGDPAFKDLLSPAAAVNVGYRFSKLSSFRLGINGWQGKGGWGDPNNSYKWNFVQADLDYMMDLARMFCGWNPNRVFNPYIFIGGGINYSFNNDEALDANANSGAKLDNAWNDSQIFPTGRAGIGIDFRLSKSVAINIEANANVTRDKFNSKKSTDPDGFFNALIGLKFNLGKTHINHPAEYDYIPVPKKVEEQEPVIEEPVVEKEPVIEEPVVEKEPVKIVIIKEKDPVVEPCNAYVFYNIGKSNVDDSNNEELNKFIECLKVNPNLKANITGYADANTGNAEVNMEVSKKRVESVKKYLVENGIKENRINTDYKGDTEQLFDTPDKNRVVVCKTL